MDIRPKTTNRHELLKVSNDKILRARKLRRKRLSIIFLITGFLIIIGVVFLLRMKFIQLNNIEVSGNVVLEKKDIQDFINKKYEGKYLWLIPKNNTLFVLPKTVTKSLQKEFPRINSINVRRNFPRSLSIEITERKGVYVWCGNDISISSTSKDFPCFFVDKEGIIFSEAPYFSGTPFTLFLGGDKDVPNILGTQLLAQDDFKNILFIYDMVNKLKLSPYTVRILTGGEYEILLRSDSDLISSTRIKLRDINDQITLSQNLAAALNTKVFKDHKISEFEYIDARFGNKVFYKLK